ncbi:MAG: HAMP domain-containing protein [Deltaproteobacteria bacterium]|nr:MAG: HAMP domain-containing protein [Deltaproteobacteria bacterium]
MRLIFKRTTSRLILALTFVVAAVTGVSAYLIAQSQEQALLDEMVTAADQLSQGIRAATWHAMRADRRSDAYAIMDAIAREQGIASIRFFNKEGLVTFSTDPHAAERVDKNAEACFLCHERDVPLVHIQAPSRARLFEGADGSRKLAIVTPIYNEASCSTAACHAHPPDQRVLGVLDVAMGTEGVDKQRAAIVRNAVWSAVVATLLMAAFIIFLTRRLVSVPLRELIRGTQAVAEMDLDRRIDIHTRDELGELAAAFNIMASRLQSALGEISDFTRALEDRVAERTRQLGVAQSKLVQADRLSSLGQLAASVAHEINNPIAGVLNFAMLMERLLTDQGVPPERLADFRRYVRAICEETARVGRIVSDLLAFSRQSSPRRMDGDLNAIVRQTAALVGHKLDLASVRLELKLADDLPPVPCDASQVQQVVINLLMNAAEATPRDGLVEVSTRLMQGPERVELVVRDSGVGIPKESLARIFDPFFTTKEEGKGVGLGLAVVYGIVQGHAGSIDVVSAPGSGTTFTVSLPLVTPEKPAADDLGGILG